MNEFSNGAIANLRRRVGTTRRLAGGLRRSVAATVAAVVVALVAACGSSGGGSSGSAQDGVNVRFAVRTGIAYLPIFIMVDKGYLRQHIPGAKSTYVNVNSSSDAATGFVGNRLDATVASSPQAIISSATGVPWKILAGTSTAIVSGITNKPDVNSLTDLKKSDVVTVPAPTSINALILYLVAKQQLGDPNALKDQIQPLPEPDAGNALTSGTTAVDVAVDPYSTMLLAKPGYHQLFNSNQVLQGAVGATFQVADRFGAKDPNVREGLRAAYTDAINLIANDPNEAARIALNNKMGSDLATNLASIKANTWSTGLNGIDQIASLLLETKLVKSAVSRSAYADPLAVANK